MAKDILGKGKNIAVSGIIAATKSAVDKNYVTAWIKRWYEEYAIISGQKRQEQVEKIFNEQLEKLEKNVGKQKILNCANLASIITSTYQGALTDLDSDKVCLYANAAISAIEKENINDAKKHMFLNMLRDFTIVHINALIFFHNPPQRNSGFQNQARMYMPSHYDIIVELASNLDVGENELNAVLNELKTKSLIQISRLDDALGTTLIKKQTTSLGDEFLDFITRQKNI